MKCLIDGFGLVFNYIFGKIFRGDKNRSNLFVIKRCFDFVVCLVEGLFDLVEFLMVYSVDLLKGYLFRIVVECGRVLDKIVSYLVVYERLRYYL